MFVSFELFIIPETSETECCMSERSFRRVMILWHLVTHSAGVTPAGVTTTVGVTPSARVTPSTVVTPPTGVTPSAEVTPSGVTPAGVTFPAREACSSPVRSFSLEFFFFLRRQSHVDTRHSGLRCHHLSEDVITSTPQRWSPPRHLSSLSSCRLLSL